MTRLLIPTFLAWCLWHTVRVGWTGADLTPAVAAAGCTILLSRFVRWAGGVIEPPCPYEYESPATLPSTTRVGLRLYDPDRLATAGDDGRAA